MNNIFSEQKALIHKQKKQEEHIYTYTKGDGEKKGDTKKKRRWKMCVPTTIIIITATQWFFMDIGMHYACIVLGL